MNARGRSDRELERAKTMIPSRGFPIIKDEFGSCFIRALFTGLLMGLALS